MNYCRLLFIDTLTDYHHQTGNWRGVIDGSGTVASGDDHCDCVCRVRERILGRRALALAHTERVGEARQLHESLLRLDDAPLVGGLHLRLRARLAALGSEPGYGWPEALALLQQLFTAYTTREAYSASDLREFLGAADALLSGALDAGLATTTQVELQFPHAFFQQPWAPDAGTHTYALAVLRDEFVRPTVETLAPVAVVTPPVVSAGAGAAACVP
jgi:hypothetical protein